MVKTLFLSSTRPSVDHDATRSSKQRSDIRKTRKKLL